jgi:hypothetical protein
MSIFTGGNYGYTFDSLIIVRVSGENSIGFGPRSFLNTVGARVRSAPLAMNPPTRGSGSTDNQIEVLWSVPASPINGNSAVLSYNLYWD